MRVHFVCTGNICRSPMAEYLLRAELERRGCGGVEVDSSGTWASDGQPATSSAADTLTAAGIDLSPHRARSLDPRFVESADVVVVMTSVHEREVLEVVPEARSKVVLMKELAKMAEPEDANEVDGGAAARLERLLRAARPERRRALDVDDPMGLPITAYRRCAEELKAGVEVLADVLCE